MATGRINKTSVDAAAPGSKDWLLWDDKLSGFGLKVTPKGAKVFIYQYRLGGRASPVRRFTIGKFGSVTADKARTVAEDLAFKVAKGIDPRAEKVEAERVSIDLAFASYSERFVKECLKAHWKASHKDGEALLTRYAVPVLKSKALPDIKRADISAVIRPLLGKPATARNMFAVLRLLFGWAVNGGDLERSPMEGIKPPPLPESRDRVLNDAELALVWQASEKLGYPFGPLARVLIATGARREEVAGLEWHELDRDARLWTLPASRAKNGVASIQPLNDLAVGELDKLARQAGREKGWPRRGFLFSTTGETTVSGFSRAKKRLDKAIAKLVKETKDAEPVNAWRLHDLRRTLATGMQKLGVRFEVTEAVLNHVSGAKSGIGGVYQRHDWGPEKIIALQSWSDHVSALLNPTDKTNVVSLAEKRA